MNRVAAIMDQLKQPDKNRNTFSPDPTRRSSPGLLRQTHHELVRLYEQHGPALVSYWKRLEQLDRDALMKNGSTCFILRNADSPCTVFSHFLGPEWNAEQITNPDSDAFLDILHHRATTSLSEQFRNGMNGAPGDCDFVRARFNQYIFLDQFDGNFMSFQDGEEYARSVDLGIYSHAIANLETEHSLWVPEPIGELVVARQIFFAELLHRVIVIMLTVLATDCRHPKCTCYNKTDDSGDRVPILTLASNSGLQPFINFIKTEEDEAIVWLKTVSSQPDVLEMEAVN
ncbi:hypothetical protein CORC01_12210 [Colletotrichum orchidophilum]|uniref:Uncharacterized protein n=1 Tax=Colletotrichum orchidophilum TaxID=1209926 RepID=A0A1G4ATW1_9PEZI|nr:uncharacterized protein CORC01_12210 [Colletotrichum orchidophilum]OHE92492.1 hypothetical protein CORC01_12210 [Colletotrichum orchidophilum]